MGQTLTHGVYLPDEGERNCYAGLAANWNILDGAVGTVAEHTTALSGKAPLVHTHTKSDITDFPAYGNAAGTICEGNDSRLSDARTPVAHTHTKSDVTDLLNSDFIPSANNSYNLGSSTYKWKTINNINPGALSFPKIGTTANTDYIDVSGNIDLSITSSQSFTAPATGWFCISFRYDKFTSCRISALNMRADCVPLGSDGYVGCYIPVTKGVTVTVRIDATAIYNARIYLCQGNV